MAYKDKEKKKACQKRYRERHKEKLKAWREKHKEEKKGYQKKYYFEHREEELAKSKSYHREARRKALGLLGGKCFFCGCFNKRLNFHEKEGESHAGSAVPLVLKNPEKFALLCTECHKGVHWCMKCLNMGWKEILIKFLDKGVR